MSGTTDTVTLPCSYSSYNLTAIPVDVSTNASLLYSVGQVSRTKTTVTFGTSSTGNVATYEYVSVGY